nr:MAG: ORF1 [TTV-like mini virus]
MPWFYRRPWYPRRRRLWRRTRKAFRRRLWRNRTYKRRYRVRRKRKLPFLRLKQWQPIYIQKLKVKLTVPLYITTGQRIANNLRLYEDQITPHYVPGGGGFSITAFTLQSLYELFQKGQCWWTKSNNEMPLIRLTGTKITLYRAESSDYIFLYHRCYPMNANVETYNATQPSIMRLNPRHIIMRCKKHNDAKKPYKKIFVKPPAQLTNKWFFQKDIATTPLLLTMASGMSLDRYYLNSNAVSTTIGFSGLNTNVFKYHNWVTPTTHGYHPRDQLYLWSFQQNTETNPPKPAELQNIKVQNLIYLGNPTKNSPGTTIYDSRQSYDPETNWPQLVDHYTTQSGYWGNIFIPFYLTKLSGIVLFSNIAPNDVLKKFSKGSETIGSKQTLTNTYYFNYFREPFIINYRYTPHADTGIDNNVFFTSNTEITQGYYPPRDTTLSRAQLPLWIACWGLIDWEKLSKGDKIDTQYFINIKTHFTNPETPTTILPLDDDFLNGNSPYRPPNNVTPSDALNWHPKTTFQYKTINAICSTGPGTIKLPHNISAEAHMDLTFYFKLGGCSQPIKNIESPSAQPDFPHPDNFFSSTSLQSPNTPITNYLYSFDWRRNYLTQKALERIQECEQPETSTFIPTGISGLNLLPIQETTSEREETSEEKEKTLQLLLRHLQQQQQHYKQRIIRLMGNME